MKKLKKLMTIIITGILIISSSALTSFADEYSEACPIKLGTTYKGIAKNNVEYYKFTLPKDGYVDFNFKENSNGQYYYYIVNENKDSISNGYVSTGTDIETDRNGLAAGTYYIKICGYGNVEYEFSVNAKYTNYWEKEPNDSFDEANIIKLNKNYKGNGYNDYYKFTLKKNGYIDVNLKENTHKKYYAKLYFNNGKSYASYSIPTGRDVYNKRVGLPAGTYYIEIYGYSNVEYEFSVNATYTDYWEKEFNNSYKSANTITLNNMYNGITEGGNYPYDFYTFDVKYSDTYSITFKQDPNVSFKYKLLDEKENCISYGTTTKGNEEETSNVDLKPGRYYIKIEKYSSDDDNTQYSFGVFSTKKDMGAFTVNKVKSSSTIITGKGLSGAKVTAYVGNIGGKKIGSTIVDQSGNYKINIQKQDSGTKIVLKIEKSGYLPKDISTTVIGLKTFDKFTVNKVSSKSTYVSGYGEKSATIRVYKNGKQIGTTTRASSKNGYFKVSIPKQKKGTKLQVKMSKTGYRSVSKYVTVK